MTMTPVELKSALEAIIYAADEPATVEQMASAVGEEKHVVRTALDELVGSYGSDERGIEIRGVAGGYRVYTKPQHHDVVRRFIKSLRPPLRLTMPALETLAVIAYKQPVTQPEIQEIRGVSCAGVIQTLLDRRLITTAGRKQVIGRPILYRTSKEFMMRFGLSDLDELPSLKEFEALAREALGTEDGVAESMPPASESASAAESTEANPADAEITADAAAAEAETPTTETPAAEHAETTEAKSADAAIAADAAGAAAGPAPVVESAPADAPLAPAATEAAAESVPAEPAGAGAADSAIATYATGAEAESTPVAESGESNPANAALTTDAARTAAASPTTKSPAVEHAEAEAEADANAKEPSGKAAGSGAR